MLLIFVLFDAFRSGTSMVSLIMPPKKQISDATKLLNEEYGKATNIKDRINRQSV